MRVLRWTGAKAVFVPELGVDINPLETVEIENEQLADEIHRDTAGWEDVPPKPAIPDVPEGEE